VSSPHHTPQLHGRRRGRKLHAPQAARLAAALPSLSLNTSSPIPDPRSLFPEKPHALWLEIGFGGGEHLVAEAKAHPHIGYIGCEIFLNGIAKALSLIDESRLGNVRLFHADARLLIEWLPPGCLHGVYLLYADPWPKRRHQDRRFLSPSMLAALARVLRPGAEIRFATDIDALAGWTLAHVLRTPSFSWEAEAAGDWQEPWPGWSSTRYEAKALAASRKPVYLTFRRRDDHGVWKRSPDEPKALGE